MFDRAAALEKVTRFGMAKTRRQDFKSPRATKIANWRLWTEGRNEITRTDATRA
jgi:hypothetical protein